MKQPKKAGKTAPKNHPKKRQTVPTIRFGIHTPDDRDPQPKNYDEIEY